MASASALERPWVREEYAAMLTRAVAGKQRLIPVLIGEVELPPFPASRACLPPEVGAAIQATLKDATRVNCPLELGLEVTDPGLSDLPWEAPQRPPPEWATPTLYTVRAVLPLYDPKVPFESVSPVPEPRLDAGVVVRRVGDFVGRRREQRIILKTLRDAQRAGVLVHGMGGVDKSTFTAQVMHRLAKDGWLLASVAGAVNPWRQAGRAEGSTGAPLAGGACGPPSSLASAAG
jgi:hypothetical protein